MVHIFYDAAHRVVAHPTPAHLTGAPPVPLHHLPLAETFGGRVPAEVVLPPIPAIEREVAAMLATDALPAAPQSASQAGWMRNWLHGLAVRLEVALRPPA